MTETRRALATAQGPAATFDGGEALAEPWLSSALMDLAPREPSLSRALAEAAPCLIWQRYDYAGPGTGPDFLGGRAFCMLIGEALGPFQAIGLDIGLFVIVPSLFHHDHAHPAPEFYLPLTGPHGWRFARDAPLVQRPALRPIWNDPGAPHPIKVGRLPFVALYAWLDRPADAAWLVPATDWAQHERQA